MRFVLMDRISSRRGACFIESMSIAELPGDSGFALLGESLFPDAGKSNQKRFSPASGPALRAGFVRSIAASGVGLKGPSMAL